MQERQPVMLTKDVYSNLVKFSRLLSIEYGRKLSFSEAERELLKRVYVEYFVEKPIRDYIMTFLDRVSVDRRIRGVALFGSVISQTYDKYSDIDLAILSGSDYFSTLSFLSEAIEHIELERKQLLHSHDLFMNISPFILVEGDLNLLKPVYFDIADFGVILFERKFALSKFLNSVRKIPHKRSFRKENEVIEWKI